MADGVDLIEVLKALPSQQLWILGDQVACARERALADEPPLAPFYDVLVKLVVAENRRRRTEADLMPSQVLEAFLGEPVEAQRPTLEEWLNRKLAERPPAAKRLPAEEAPA